MYLGAFYRIEGWNNAVYYAAGIDSYLRGGKRFLPERGQTVGTISLGLSEPVAAVPHPSATNLCDETVLIRMKKPE